MIFTDCVVLSMIPGSVTSRSWSSISVSPLAGVPGKSGLVGTPSRCQGSGPDSVIGTADRDDHDSDERVWAMSVTRVSGRRDREEAPRARDALQLMLAASFEGDPRAGDDVFHGARDQDLARRGPAGDAGTDVDGDPTDLAIDDLALSGV